ncbi:hypothetical protein SAMN04487950_1178 [Halogranum rubrum]|uniref:Uncharacterized protein n=1 Tax=Halogranum rubrum TaxID=553466 RepID=A0A1I4CGU5_9EURY|nr:hypothetical protein [Halogranum rubrum]SFK80462.1 hypothetical protein SAMN04487950_1178 [Halogranum rubrum]
MSSENDFESGDDATGLATITRDALGEWQLWLTALGAIAVAAYAFTVGTNVPNGYVPFFGVLGVLATLYGFHDMQTTPDLT